VKTYHGSCHCETVRFEVNALIEKVVDCNCSICTKKGALHHRVTAEQFKLIAGEDSLGLYQFDSKEAKHYFCKKCGIHSFSYPRIAPDEISINVRCLDDFDLETEQFEAIKFDGRNWEQAAAKIRRGK